MAPIKAINSDSIPNLWPTSARIGKGSPVKKASKRGLSFRKLLPRKRASSERGEQSPAQKLLSVSASSVFKRRGKAPRARRNGDMHPLHARFQETTMKYRKFLYEHTVNAINADYDKLVATLHDCDIQATGNSQDADAESPLRLTFASRLKREMGNMYIPLGHSKLIFKKEKVEMSLEQRMGRFDEYVQEKKAEMFKQHQEWERVVGEIFKVGTHIFGKHAMDSLLPSSSPAQAQRTSEPLFMQDDDDDVVETKARAAKPKKRVSSGPPQFLAGPSESKPVPAITEAPVEQRKQLEQAVRTLGDKECGELKKLQENWVQWQEKKAMQLQIALSDDL